MKSLRIDNNKQDVLINVHMELVYSEIKHRKNTIDINIANRNSNKLKVKNYFSVETLYKTLFVELRDNEIIDKYQSYSWILDFKYIKTISSGAMNEMISIFSAIDNKYICNAETLCEDNKNKLNRNGFKLYEGGDVYKDTFSDAVLNYLENNKKCRIDQVTNETGEIISNYINLKPFLEDHEYMFPACYLLAEKLIDIIRGQETRFSLFCHTLNGAAMASAISMILGVDVMYADNLNVSGMLRKKYMPNSFKSEKKCIIVTDMVCQGHEIIRAKDIINMLGGDYSGNVCLVSVELSGTNDDRYSLLILDKTKRDRLNYKIKIGD